MMLRAIVLLPNEKTRDAGSRLAIARAEAQKREHTHAKVTVLAVPFIPELGVYVALYEPPVGCSKRLGVRRGKNV